MHLSISPDGTLDLLIGPLSYTSYCYDAIRDLPAVTEIYLDVPFFGFFFVRLGSHFKGGSKFACGRIAS
jgi:hypothetical protein